MATCGVSAHAAFWAARKSDGVDQAWAQQPESIEQAKTTCFYQEYNNAAQAGKPLMLKGQETVTLQRGEIVEKANTCVPEMLTALAPENKYDYMSFGAGAVAIFAGVAVCSAVKGAWDRHHKGQRQAVKGQRHRMTANEIRTIRDEHFASKQEVSAAVPTVG